MNCQPTKELVRAWLQERQSRREPPPEPEQIRRNVGWAPLPTAWDKDAPETREGVPGRRP